MWASSMGEAAGRSGREQRVGQEYGRDGVWTWTASLALCGRQRLGVLIQQPADIPRPPSPSPSPC